MPETLAPSQPRVTRLSDYRPPQWLARTVALFVDLHEDHAEIRSRVRYERAPMAGGGVRSGPGAGAPSGPGSDAGDAPLRLDGTASQLELVALRLDGVDVPPDAYTLDEESLVLWPDRERFDLEVIARTAPHRNTALSGLYRSGSIFCTQMEAEGFRRMSWFQDRPDVLATWTTTIEAERARYPVLLGNGNAGGTPYAGLPPLRAGRHRVTWHDPFPKPCYLFALVAGDLGLVEGRFTTRSGRLVPLRFYVDKGNEAKVEHALASLQRAMAWDERAFGREYDLDVFMVVAVNDFNMGAMENKGLNIFNAARVLADARTATDEDFQRIEGVIGHEYFHNWSGNRVTCRDWFQISLKEGFTVYRDQEFTSDLNARAAKRIEDVRRLRKEQFPEDAGPLAHPIRPASYIAIDNFYTRTVYEKGAEVIRMQATLLGPALFRRGCDLYFERHDGQAVTTEDFLLAMEAASGKDLAQFRRWYEQAGTPVLAASGSWDAAARRYTLHLSQRCPPTPGQPRKQPFHMPVSVALLGSDGREIPGTARVLELRKERESCSFENLPADAVAPAAGAARGASGLSSGGPVPSVLRGFSAPVKLQLELTDDELLFLVAHDGDLFNRWEALQQLATRVLLRAAGEQRAGRPVVLEARLVRAFECVLDAAAAPAPGAAAPLEPAIAAELLRLPEESVLCEEQALIDIEALHAARVCVRDALARACRGRWLACYRRLDSGERYSPDAAAIGRRALKNVALGYLVLADAPQAADTDTSAPDTAAPATGAPATGASDTGASDTGSTDSGLALCLRQFETADNLTDQLCALELLAAQDGPERARALEAFRTQWAHEPLVLNKWISAQAGADRPGVLDDVLALARDPLLKDANPNRLRALYGSFASNLPHFHAADGRGYRLYGDMLAELDGRNPVIAGRFALAFNLWRRHAEPRRGLMRAQLERLAAVQGLSLNTREVVSKALA